MELVVASDVLEVVPEPDELGVVEADVAADVGSEVVEVETASVDVVDVVDRVSVGEVVVVADVDEEVEDFELDVVCAVEVEWVEELE